ncbi:MAG: flagellar protein FlgN [Spirochaetes bacterium]|jgi:flagellar biosynthesis/type III secretory pathway chaperone|nr:flagellar protein FlgN [Spirochaetota bacterium]
MIQPVIVMERILTEERDLFEKIYELEGKKSEAIIKRDGNAIEKLSLEQESLLAVVADLESKREEQIRAYVRENAIEDLPKSVTLTDIVVSMDEDSSRHLMRLGIELKRLLEKLSDLKNTNERLIRDNMAFYNMLISGLRSSSYIETGYKSDGRHNGINANPLFFNKTA